MTIKSDKKKNVKGWNHNNKLILKTISNKTNNNLKNANQIWQKIENKIIIS
jgi:hypothetical protein